MKTPAAPSIQVGEELILARNIGISVHEMNGQQVNKVIDYLEGDFLEILDEVGHDSYRIAFWADQGVIVNGLPITYEFDKETILSWVMPDKKEC